MKSGVTLITFTKPGPAVSVGLDYDARRIFIVQSVEGGAKQLPIPIVQESALWKALHAAIKNAEILLGQKHENETAKKTPRTPLQTSTLVAPGAPPIQAMGEAADPPKIETDKERAMTTDQKNLRLDRLRRGRNHSIRRYEINHRMRR